MQVIAGVECYGEVEENSNFIVTCEDEEFDGIWTEGNPNTEEPFKSWSEVVVVLQPFFDNNIFQIDAI